MNMNRKLISAIAVSIVLVTTSFSCSQKRVMHFDADHWREDTSGCHGSRMKIYEKLMKYKKDLLALNNEEIIKILGPPAFNELYKRNQKFFIYHITPASSCAKNNINGEELLYLIIRFNAVGLSTEIYINNRQSPFTKENS